MKLYLDKEYELDCQNKLNYFEILYGNGDSKLRSIDDNREGDYFPYKIRITSTKYKFINQNAGVSD